MISSYIMEVKIYDIIRFIGVYTELKNEFTKLDIYSSFMITEYVDYLTKIEKFVYERVSNSKRLVEVEKYIEELCEETFILNKCGVKYTMVESIFGEVNSWCSIFFT